MVPSHDALHGQEVEGHASFAAWLNLHRAGADWLQDWLLVVSRAGPGFGRSRLAAAPARQHPISRRPAAPCACRG